MWVPGYPTGAKRKISFLSSGTAVSRSAYFSLQNRSVNAENFEFRCRVPGPIYTNTKSPDLPKNELELVGFDVLYIVQKYNGKQLREKMLHSHLGRLILWFRSTIDSGQENPLQSFQMIGKFSKPA